MRVKVVLKGYLAPLMGSEDVQHEIADIQRYVDSGCVDFADNEVNVVFLRGNYDHLSRTMRSVLLVVNCLNAPISELHGVLRLRLKGKNANVAKVTLNMAEAQLGMLGSDEGLPLHLDIPVKGLDGDCEIRTMDIEGSFGEVRVTYAEMVDE